MAKLKLHWQLCQEGVTFNSCLSTSVINCAMAEKVCEYEMIQGKRRDKTILHSIEENQLYVKNKVLASGSISYSCSVKNCKARVYKKDGCCYFAEPFQGHSHGDKKEEIEELKLLTKIKENCAKPTASQTTSQISEVREIFDNAVIENQSSQLNFNKHRRNLLQIRNSNIPKPPKSAREVIEAYKNAAVIQNYSLTKHEASKYEFYKGSYECDDFAYSYFASDHVMDNIRANIPEETRNFLMDATFKICPLGEFYQLLVIYNAFCDQAIPFIYVLMSRKTEICYIHLFQTLKEIFPLNGNSVMTDYELAMRNAIRHVYPNIKMNTCWFHFCQAAKRKASQLMNLGHHIKSNAKIRIAYYKLLSLPLLPAKDIVSSFQIIKSQVADEKAFKEFLRYFEKQWIKKEGPDAISVFKLTNRTTSSLEAQNGVLGKRLMKHGHFFKFVGFLLSYEYTKSREFDLLIKSGGSTAPGKNRFYKHRSDKIAEASELLEKNQISAQVFLNRMSYPDNRICTHLDDFSDVDEARSENDNLFEDEEDSEPGLSQPNSEGIKVLPCCVCLDKTSHVKLYPCGHLKVCSNCWTTLVDDNNTKLSKFIELDLEEEYRPKLKCPFCSSNVENYVTEPN